MLPLREGARARSVGRFAILYYGCYTIDRQRAAAVNFVDRQRADMNFVDRKRPDMNFHRASGGRSVFSMK